MREDEDISLFNIKLICAVCDWKGMSQDVDKVSDPRGDAVWQVCPSCRTPEHILIACDESDCWKLSVCSTPAKGGYRQTCSKHRPPIKKSTLEVVS